MPQPRPTGCANCEGGICAGVCARAAFAKSQAKHQTVRKRDLMTVVFCALALWGSYLIGMTTGYSGCVVGASELHTNRILRSM